MSSYHENSSLTSLGTIITFLTRCSPGWVILWRLDSNIMFFSSALERPESHGTLEHVIGSRLLACPFHFTASKMSSWYWEAKHTWLSISNNEDQAQQRWARPDLTHLNKATLFNANRENEKILHMAENKQINNLSHLFSSNAQRFSSKYPSLVSELSKLPNIFNNHESPRARATLLSLFSHYDNGKMVTGMAPDPTILKQDLKAVSIFACNWNERRLQVKRKNEARLERELDKAPSVFF